MCKDISRLIGGEHSGETAEPSYDVLRRDDRRFVSDNALDVRKFRVILRRPKPIPVDEIDPRLLIKASNDRRPGYPLMAYVSSMAPN